LPAAVRASEIIICTGICAVKGRVVRVVRIVRVIRVVRVVWNLILVFISGDEIYFGLVFEYTVFKEGFPTLENKFICFCEDYILISSISFLVTN